ncbi:LPS translocon maturation chaperone LptM [Aliidiomarina quisquiliarum]|nr:lipoprotein [Aliidiomarina quisquiliarum]MCO4322503.1 lipoprotein [Aliidiomarina quisquiliarum]
MIKRTSLAVLLFLLVLSVAGCGQKGPLYLPEQPPANDTPSTEPSPPET